MPKIFVSTYPYGVYDPTPLNLLNETGWEIITNPYKRKLTPEEDLEFASDVDGIIAGTEDLTLLVLNNPNLKMISRVGIGLDSVPLLECKKRNIRVSYTPDAVTMGVAELTIGLMLSTSRYIVQADKEIRNRLWTRFVGKRIGESTIGIIGCGRVGSNVIRLLSSFIPQKILINDILDKSREVSLILDKTNISYSFVEKEEIYKNSDIVSLHIPLNQSTKNLITQKELSLFRKHGILINTSRGEIVREDDLYLFLKKNPTNQAALDVFIKEPYIGNLTELDNILLTQHIGSCSFDCRHKMETEAAMEMIRFFKGQKLENEIPEN